MSSHTTRRRIIVFFSLLVFTLFLGVFSLSAQGCECEVPPSNCAVPITSLNGEGYTPSGIAGGLTVTTPGIVINPAMWLSGNIGIREDTALLVVDSFGDVPPSAKGFIIPDTGLAATDDASLEQAYFDGTLSHGALVFNHVNALVQSALLSSGSPLSSAADDVSITWDMPSGNRLVVRMVDALDYGILNALSNTTGHVADRITDAINDLRMQGYTSFVLNMSFAIIPCTIVDRYNQANAADPSLLLERYITNLAGANTFIYNQLITPIDNAFQPDPLRYQIGRCNVMPSSEEQSAAKQVSQQEPPPPDGLTENDPLEEALPCQPGDHVTFVGAAGNSKLPFPFYPAAYPEVISVSAAEVVGGRSFYTNYNADVGLAGGWFKLNAYTEAVDDKLTEITSPSAIYYRGTSFAGPLEATCIALQLTSPMCDTITNP